MLPRSAGERLGSGIDFDARNDPATLARFDEQRTRGALLVDRLVVQDDPRNELLGTGSHEQELPVVPAGLRRRSNLERVEPLRYGGNRFVCSEDSLTVPHEGLTVDVSRRK
jgi:hypothetical protein